MGVVMTGLDYKTFVKDDWGPEVYWEEVVLVINGVERDDDFEADTFLADDDRVEIVGGTLRKNDDGEFYGDAVKFARNWMRMRTHETVLVSVDKTVLDEFRQYVKAFKGASIVSGRRPAGPEADDRGPRPR